MKKILLTYVLSGMTTMAMAGVGVGFSTTTNNVTNVNQLAQCNQMDEAKLNMLSQINMQKQICLYENYAQLTQRWTTTPPEPYLPPNTIILNVRKQEVSPEMKEKLSQTSQQCQSVATNMRAKLKEMYGVDNFSCR